MTDRPIIFAAPMVRVLLAGRKTQTRRLVKVPGIMGGRFPILPPEDAIELEEGEFRRATFHYRSTGALSGPYRLPAAVGDRLYVREAHRLTDCPCTEACRGPGNVYYEADGDGYQAVFRNRLRPSIHMPRWASRLTLTVTDVRVEPLQAISEADARAEGLTPAPGGWWSGAEGQAGTTPQAAYALLWNSLHTREGERWQDNPQVVALTFRVEHGNIDKLVRAA